MSNIQVIKIYCFSTDDCEHLYHKLTDEEFIAEAERHGDIFDLDTFANAFNQSDVNTNTDVIRIITTEIPNPMHTRLIGDINGNIIFVDNAIRTGQDKSFIIGYLKQALKHVKDNISPSPKQ